MISSIHVSAGIIYSCLRYLSLTDQDMFSFWDINILYGFEKKFLFVASTYQELTKTPILGSKYSNEGHACGLCIVLL